MSINKGDCADAFEEVTLWYITGATGEYFSNKLLAEARARSAFPHESYAARYARLFYTTFFREKS